MNDLENYLTSGQNNYAKISAETLEMMGKQASNRFIEEGISLNDSIAKLAGAHPNISPEQVKRIAEFANTSTFLAYHDRNKTAGSEHSYPQFPLADASRIVQDLSDGARPTVVTQTDIDYSRLANREKLSSTKTEQALTDLFKTASEEKDYSSNTIVEKLLASKGSLVSLKDNLASSYDINEALFKEATADLYKDIKIHLLEGGTLTEVASVCLSTGTKWEKVSEILGPMTEQLLKEKLVSPKERLTKVAYRIVNPEHPIVKSFSAVKLASEELQTLSHSIVNVSKELDQVQKFIKETYL